MRSRHHHERHTAQNSGWLRAAVLGANDGIISTSSLIVGIASGETSSQALFLAATAGLVAGAMSMAAGEFVSVSSQSDMQKSDLEREKKELSTNAAAELQELADIYVQRGLTRDLAGEVARQLTAHDALGSHARDELGITELARPRPLQAASASALAFSAGALLPLLLTLFVPVPQIIPAVGVSTLLCLAALGFLSAHLGKAPKMRGVVRIVFWGAVAMGVTAVIGRMVGATV